MPKNSSTQIGIDENKILNQIKTNANRSINKIAKDCSFSRQKVWRVLKNLEKNNTIWGYSTVVDEEKQGLNYYILLLRRGAQPVDQDVVNNITSREIDAEINKIGCDMITSLYVHGNYDWVIIFSAPNTVSAKKVSELFKQKYQKYLVDFHLLETIFPVKIQGIVNPEIKKLNEFF